METFLFHSSGEFISGECFLPVVIQNPQGIGSCITYARRYTLQSVLGIAAEDEDDDGNAASGISATSTPSTTFTPTSPSTETEKFISEPQRKRLFAIAYQSKVPSALIKHYLVNNYQIESTNQIPVSFMMKLYLLYKQVKLWI